MRQWVQVTHLGLQAAADGSDLVAWTTVLGSGAPLAGAHVTCGGGSGVTGADGLTQLACARDASVTPGQALVGSCGKTIIATKDGDSTLLRDGLCGYAATANPTRFFTFDDRTVYKPGEDVHVKGWVRDVGHGKGSDVSLLPASATLKLHWVARDEQNAELSKGDAGVDALGGFDFVVTTPKNANLGDAEVSLEIPSHGSGTHTFEIQEFRRPEFEVSASAGEGPNLVGGHATATVDAKYYAGGGLPGAGVVWNVTRVPGFFTPPNREDFVFGGNPWEDRRPPKRGQKPDAHAARRGRAIRTRRGPTACASTSTRSIPRTRRP